MKRAILFALLMTGYVYAQDASNQVNVICGKTEQNDYYTRIKAIKNIGKEIQPAEYDAYLAFLKIKDGEDKLPLSQMNALKNEVLSALRASHKQDQRLAEELVAMFKDKSYDGVWRDYCIQHLGDMMQFVKPESQVDLAKMFFDATEKERDSSIAGTALIALMNNLGRPDAITKESVSAKALAILDDAKVGELAKITALQICAKAGESKLIEYAKTILSGEGSVPLKVSAIGALGLIGSDSEKTILEKLVSNSDTRLQIAAKAAVVRIDQRKPKTK